jgi:C1A family cysteine protease
VHGPLPATVRKLFKDGKQKRISKYAKINPKSIQALKKTLALGFCIGLSVKTYHFWEDDYAFREGIISLPLSLEPDGAHAICLVGYRDNDENHSDGYFIFKNSWDVTWGYGRADPGYGSLPYRYVLREAIEAYTVEV